MTVPHFTPAPWRLGADLSRIHPAWRDDDGNLADETLHRNGYAKTIATIGREHDWRDTEQFVADGRLIAASPDLYAACYAAYQQIDGEQYPDLIGPLHAALAKARGEQ